MHYSQQCVHNAISSCFPAPTNEAFAKLPAKTLEFLLLPENKDELVDILKYHVVSANAPSSSLESGDVPTLNGDSVSINVSDDGIEVNDAMVVKADVIASNGIIHVIDTVLMPPKSGKGSYGDDYYYGKSGKGSYGDDGYYSGKSGKASYGDDDAGSWGDSWEGDGSVSKAQSEMTFSRGVDESSADNTRRILVPLAAGAGALLLF